MTLLKQAMAILGTVLTIAIIVAIVSPKTAQAVAAAFVQIQPGTTTHLGQNETQLVSLSCKNLGGLCVILNPDGTLGTTAYTVPAGYTLVVTDWKYLGFVGGGAGNHAADSLFVTNTGSGPGNLVLTGDTTTIGPGIFFQHNSYTTGIRVPSGWQLGDTGASNGVAVGYVQGYLVPN